VSVCGARRVAVLSVQSCGKRAISPSIAAAPPARGCHNRVEGVRETESRFQFQRGRLDARASRCTWLWLVRVASSVPCLVRAVRVPCRPVHTVVTTVVLCVSAVPVSRVCRRAMHGGRYAFAFGSRARCGHGMKFIYRERSGIRSLGAPPSTSQTSNISMRLIIEGLLASALETL
jgi:hypothetical protein